MLPVPPRRSDPELMDRCDNTRADLEEALRDLRLVNRWLGGRRALLLALEPFLAAWPAERPMQILDVGTGGADLPRDMVDYAGTRGRSVTVVAVERDRHSAAIAQRAAESHPGIRVVRADAWALPFPDASFDIVTASLFLHHIEQERVCGMLQGLCRLARSAVLVNDLRRHLFPWAFVQVVGRLSRRGAMFLHDGPLSVLRGFTDAELAAEARRCGARQVSLRRRWPFRLVLTLGSAP